jgi:hypothetical protein
MQEAARSLLTIWQNFYVIYDYMGGRDSDRVVRRVR